MGIPTPKLQTIGQRLKWAMKRANDMKPAALARACKVSRPAVGPWLSDESEPTATNLANAADALRVDNRWLATGRGSPDANNNIVQLDQERDKSAIETVHSDINFANIVFLREMDVRAAAGGNGGLVDVMHGNEDDATVGRYGFPIAEVQNLFGSSDISGVVICEVRGDSMLPTLHSGQKVAVNTADKSPTPPGIFYVWDGNGLVCKRVEFIPFSDPPAVRISSDNKAYAPYERLLGEAYIQGRVVGGWDRM